ncbi:MAG: hypothetical protein V1779_14680 [bacterium]
MSILIILAITFNNLKGDGGKLEDLNYNYKQFNSIIYLTAGYVFSAGSKDFFTNYRKFTGGKKNEFVFFPLGGVGTKFQFWKGYRVGLETEFFYTQMKDAYIEELPGYDKKDQRTISQDFSFKSFPSFITFEYIPLQQQFRTYTGIGLGVVFSEITWNELLNSSVPFDKRQGGEHYNEFGIYPSGRIYAGLELGFDKYETENFVGSFIIEVKYTAMFRNAAIFKEIAEQFEQIPEGINEEYSILPGYLGLYMGLTFNFNRRRK